MTYIQDGKLSVGSLFSGIGGMELGLERTGRFRTIWFSEIDPYASAVLDKHWPGTPNIGDIRIVDWQSIRRPDVLTGGFPCQDISNAGNRAGITGERSGLWKEYLKAIRILRPKIIIAENVSALINRGLDVVLTDLAQVGYDIEWDCIPACAVGAPHRRDRIFIVAYSNSSRYLHRQFEKQPTERRIQTQREPITSNKDVTNTDSIREQIPITGEYTAEQMSGSVSTNRKATDVADTDSSRPINPRFDNNRAHKDWTKKAEERLFKEQRIRIEQQSAINRRSWWGTEPCVGRVADGIPNRVDRIKCLGNAIVPQVAELIGQMVISRIES